MRKYPVSAASRAVLSEMKPGEQLSAGEICWRVGEPIKKITQYLLRLHIRGLVLRTGRAGVYRYEISTTGLQVVNPKRGDRTTDPRPPALQLLRALYAGCPVRTHRLSDEERA